MPVPCRGQESRSFKPFYRGAKVTAIGAISLNKVLALMTINDSMNGAVFAVFVEKCLCPQLWAGAVVVMDNLPAHKRASIVPMIEAYGARVICLSHTLLILTQLNFGGHNSNPFCESFLPLPRP